MSADDRIMIAKCFLFSMRILFEILYVVTDKVDEEPGEVAQRGRRYKDLFADYKGLAYDLKRWYSPDASASADPPPDAASIEARWSG